MPKVKNPVGNPNIVEAGKKTQITPENAREMQARGVEARNAFAERKRILLSKAKLSDESKNFWASLGFEGDDLAFVTNDMKLQEKGIKKAKEKGDLIQLIKLFESWGIVPEKEITEIDEKEDVEFLVTRVTNDKKNP